MSQNVILTKRLFFIIVFLLFFLNGCSSNTAENIKPITPELVNKINEADLTENTPEYVAYHSIKKGMAKDFEGVLPLYSNEMKQKYAEMLTGFLAEAIRYKYYEPVYALFGKNIPIEQIRKIPSDQLLAKFLMVSIRMNFSVRRVELEFQNIKTSNTDSQIIINYRYFVPMANGWEKESAIVHLKNQNGQWKIVKDQLTEHINSRFNYISKCQSKEQKSRSEQSYSRAIQTLNYDICRERARLTKTFSSDSPLLTKSSFEERLRDTLFSNEYCMEFHNAAPSPPLRIDIVNEETCKQLNIAPN